jgi:hypothetical protein
MFKVQRSKSVRATLNLEPGTLNRVKHFVTFVVQCLFHLGLCYCRSAWRISRYRLTR